MPGTTIAKPVKQPVKTTPKALDNALCYIPTIDAPTMQWEREVYEADPLGGSPSRY
jgi:hypothetical protein